MANRIRIHGIDDSGIAEGLAKLLSSKDLSDRFGNLSSRLFINLLASMTDPEVPVSPRLLLGITCLLDSFGESLFISPDGTEALDSVEFLLTIKTLLHSNDLEVSEIASTILLTVLKGMFNHCSKLYT